jgi:hypothetical protein
MHYLATMKKYYWILMLAGGLLALAPGLQFMLVTMTGGLLIPILFLPSLAYYGLCLLPVVVSGSGRTFRLPSKVVPVLLLIGLLFTPGFLYYLNSYAIERQAENLAAILPKANLDFTVDVPFRQDAIANCNVVCGALLKSSLVSAVHVQDSKASIRNGRTYKIFADNSCAPGGSSSDENSVRIERILDGGKCLVSTNDTLNRPGIAGGSNS